MSGTKDRINVLHVDDEPDFAEMAAEFLARQDDRIAVQTTTSAQEGFDKLADSMIDCIVSDYNMPGMDGIEFLETVRENHPDLPFILYTGKGSEEVADDAISAGVTDYLQKRTGTEQYSILANRVVNAVESFRATQDIERQNDLFAKAQNIANVGAWEYDLKTDTYYSTDEVLRIHGLSPEEHLNKEKSIEYYHPDDRPVIREAIEQAIQGDPYDEKLRLIDDEGTERWVRTRGQPQLADGEIIRVRGTIQDITKREQREQELKRQSTIFERAQEVGEIGWWQIALPSNEITWSKQVYDMWAAEGDVSSIDYETFLDFIHPEDTEYVDEQWEAAKKGKSYDVDHRIITGDGDVKWMHEQADIFFDEDGEPDSAIGIVQDITERKEREQELKHLKKRLELAVEGAELGVWDWNIQTNQTRYNTQWTEILGYSQAGLEPSFTAWKNNIHPDDLPEIETAIDAHLTNGTSLFDEEYRIRTATGDWKWVHTIGRVVERNENGDPLRAVGIHQDITERKEREEQLRQEKDRLEEFASVVSHDLRNPLNVAQGRIELAQEACEIDHLDDAANGVERSLELIEDLLDLARSGQEVSDLEAVKVADLVNSCWETVETADATAVADLESTIRADNSRLHQLLENLFRNAVEHGSEDVTIRIGSLPEGFYVEDDGPGIPEDERETIWEAGYSGDEEGPGFGLSIVQQIVEAHDWNIRVTEGSEGGARFEITGVEFAAE